MAKEALSLLHPSANQINHTNLLQKKPLFWGSKPQAMNFETSIVWLISTAGEGNDLAFVSERGRAAEPAGG